MGGEIISVLIVREREEVRDNKVMVERGEDSVDWDRGWMVMVDIFMVGLEYCLRE